jgi:Insertion element 4 transposase N-terminal/Transposase DDE domain
VGELTRIVPFEMVDAVLSETGKVQVRVRDLPARVVVYLLLAGALFAEIGYAQVWTRMTAGLDGLTVANPTAGALAQARRRLGPTPLKALFTLLSGSAAGPATTGVYWRGLLVTAIDGTTMCCPDSAANLKVFCRGGSNHGGTGYPMLRLLALVACGTRAVIDATFGSTSVGETRCAADLVAAVRPGMIVLADRNFAAQNLIAAIAERGAHLLIRAKNSRRLPVCRRLPDGSYVSRIGTVEVRVIIATVTITTSAGRRAEIYTLLTTVLDPQCPAAEIKLYHERWEIETSFLELKSTILGGRVLRARTPGGVDQEVYALLVTYQALRIAITDATIARRGLDPDRGSFSVALNTARDQLVAAAGVIAEDVIDLVGVIGRHVLAAIMPARRPRTAPRVVKRAISNYAPKTATGRIRGPSRNTTIEIDIIPTVDP